MPNRRKLENAAMALLIFGAIMIVPPILSIFNIPKQLFGAPLVVIYLFAIWIVLISATFFLSSRLLANKKNKLDNNSADNNSNGES